MVMNKVYLVSSGHEHYVKAVFTDKDKALEYVKRLNFIPKPVEDKYYVEDFVYHVDPEIPDIPTYTYAYAFLFNVVDIDQLELTESDVDFRQYPIDFIYGGNNVLYEVNEDAYDVTIQERIDIYPDDNWKTIRKRGYKALCDTFEKWKKDAERNADELQE